MTVKAKIPRKTISIHNLMKNPKFMADAALDLGKVTEGFDPMTVQEVMSINEQVLVGLCYRHPLLKNTAKQYGANV
jgi:hypothetical protein